MARRMTRLPTPEGIGAGQTATVRLPIGPTYHRLDLRIDGATLGNTPVPLASFTNYVNGVRLIVNGDVKIDVTAEFLQMRARLFGQVLQPGVLPIFLSMPWARTPQGEDQTAYGTADGVASITLEFDLTANREFGTVLVYASQSAPTPFGPHLRIQRFAKSFAAIGVDEVSDFPLGGYALMNIDVSSDDIGNVEVLANNQSVHESDAAVRGNEYNIAGRVPQSGYTHIDFMLENRVQDTMPMALQDFRLKLGFTAAPGAYDAYLTSIHGR